MTKSSALTTLFGTLTFLVLVGLVGLIEGPIFGAWQGLAFIDHRSLGAFLFVFSLGPLSEEIARLITSIAVLRRPIDRASASTTIAVGLGFGLIERLLSWILHAGTPSPDLAWLWDFRAIAGHGGLSALLWLMLRRWGLNPLLALGACAVLHVATNLSTRLLPTGLTEVMTAGVLVTLFWAGLILFALQSGRSPGEASPSPSSSVS